MDLAALCACLVEQDDFLSASELVASVSECLASASPAICLSVHHTATGIAFSFVQGSAALTLLPMPGAALYSPVVAGRSDNEFSGFSTVEVSLLWHIAHQLWEVLWLESRSTDIATISHIARGGKASTVPGRAESTVKNRLSVVRKEYGVRTNPALIATMLRRGELR